MYMPILSAFLFQAVLSFFVQFPDKFDIDSKLNEKSLSFLIYLNLNMIDLQLADDCRKCTHFLLFVLLFYFNFKPN